MTLAILCWRWWLNIQIKDFKGRLRCGIIEMETFTHHTWYSSNMSLKTDHQHMKFWPKALILHYHMRQQCFICKYWNYTEVSSPDKQKLWEGYTKLRWGCPSHTLFSIPSHQQKKHFPSSALSAHLSSCWYIFTLPCLTACWVCLCLLRTYHILCSEGSILVLWYHTLYFSASNWIKTSQKLNPRYSSESVLERQASLHS